MDQPDRAVEQQFTQPYRQILVMLIVLGLVSVGAWLAYPQVARFAIDLGMKNRP